MLPLSHYERGYNYSPSGKQGVSQPKATNPTANFKCTHQNSLQLTLGAIIVHLIPIGCFVGFHEESTEPFLKRALPFIGDSLETLITI